MKTCVLAFCVAFLSLPAFAQPAAAAAPAAQPAGYANFSIMLVNPAGGAVVLMHNTKGQLEYVDVGKTKEAFAAGYVPARVAEISEVIASLNNEVQRLTAENTRLQNAGATPAQQESGLNETNCHTYQWLKNASADQLRTCAALYPAYVPNMPPAPTAAEIAAQQRAQADAERRERRQQLVQTWLMLQAVRPPTPVYQLPVPMNPNAGRLQANCTTQHLGNTTYTNCN